MKRLPELRLQEFHRRRGVGVRSCWRCRFCQRRLPIRLPRTTASIPIADQWQGPYRSLNYDYPQEAGNGWLETAPRVPLSIGNAGDYVSALKAFLAPTMDRDDQHAQ